MKPTYGVKAWQDDGWWLARVVAASDGADSTPLDALTQARTLAKIGPMARDLIATILDVDEDTFDIELEYALPGDVGELVREAKGARAWLDAAQGWWQERSAAAARALTDKGYSLRETAKLLGLSHQRVDQLLEGAADAGRPSGWAVQPVHYPHGGPYSCWRAAESLSGADVVVVVRNPGEQDRRWIPRAEQMHEVEERIGAFLVDCAERAARRPDIPAKSEENSRRVDA